MQMVYLRDAREQNSAGWGQETGKRRQEVNRASLSSMTGLLATIPTVGMGAESHGVLYDTV